MGDKKKAIVLLSGGLDSRLVVKILQDQDFEVTTLFFNLPFGTGCCDKNCSFSFSQLAGVKMKIIDCSKGKLLQEYLDILKKPKHPRGAGINPCIDCRIFMFKLAKKFAEKKGIKVIATGEVLGQRPMSQMTRSLKIIEEESGLKGKLLRPLSARLLKETEFEKEGLIDREKLYGVHGRSRKKQMELAKKFGFDYPSSGGGCALCEKNLSQRFKVLLDRGLNEFEIGLVCVGRHFMIGESWIVLGRNERENKIIEFIGNKNNLKIIVPGFNGPSAVIIGDVDGEFVGKIISAYSKEGCLKDRKKFEKFRL